MSLNPNTWHQLSSSSFGCVQSSFGTCQNEIRSDRTRLPDPDPDPVTFSHWTGEAKSDAGQSPCPSPSPSQDVGAGPSPGLCKYAHILDDFWWHTAHNKSI